MARPKKAEQLGLGQQPAGAAATPAPPPRPVPAARVEYQNGTERWLCKRFDALVAELPGLTAAVLPQLHAALETQDRQWTLTRRLFGLMPEVPSTKYPIDDMRVWEPEELARFLNIAKGDQWQQELAAVRGVWAAVRPKAEEGRAKSEERKPENRGLFADDEIIRKYDFGRIRFRDTDEMARFVARLRSVEKLFIEQATAGLARNLLTTEFQITRLDEALTVPENLGEEWRKSAKQRSDLVDDYNKQLSLIDRLAPWFGAIAGKYSFKGSLAEVTAAIQQYYAEGATVLLDGIFTATEVQVECRRSVQAPEPRYRLGWVTHALEAKANLWNPAWRSTTPLTVLKRLDAGMKAGLIAAGQEMGEALVDLQKSGAEGEYQPVIQHEK